MLILSQERWRGSDAESDLGPILKAALADISITPEAVLVLLPLGETHWPDAPVESSLRTALATLAQRFEIYLAGAVGVRSEDGEPARTIGFVFDPQGNLLLRVGKSSPDFLEGFTDSACELGQVPEALVCETPLGRLGMLINEDVLFSHYARRLVYAGAEVILNPAREKKDYMFDSRQRSRATRAYESSAYVAVATPSRIDRAGYPVKLPTASALYCYDQELFEIADRDESFLVPDFDIALLRRKRATPFMNQPVYLRTALYAPGLKRLAEAAAERAPEKAPSTRIEWLEEARTRIEAQANTNREALPANPVNQYDAILVQNEFRVIQKTTTDPGRIIQKNLTEALDIAGRNAANPNIKLVCFPEFFMTGSGGSGFRTPATLDRIAVTYPGPELDQISEFAMRNKVYVAGSSFEKDPNFPGRVFNSAFIIDDTGALIHRYRKIHCADIWGALPDTTPGSVLTEYVDQYGYDSLFPICDSPLGRLATMVCFDHTVPETARMLAQLGAEVIIHCTSDPHGAGRRPWEECRLTRAFDNSAYILAPRPGGEYFDPEAQHPGTFLRGYTRAINFDGRLLGEADTSGKVGFNCSLDLDALRRHRANVAANQLIWDDARGYAHLYEAGFGLPSDLWAGNPHENPYVGFKQMLAVLERYYGDGTYLKPDAVTKNPLADKKMDSEFVSM